MLKKAKSIESLNKIADRVLNGIPRKYLLHWKKKVDGIVFRERKRASMLIQRVVRGYFGRCRARREEELDRKERDLMIRNLCAASLLERKGRLVGLFRADLQAISRLRCAGAVCIQGAFRRYCSQRFVGALQAQKANDLRLARAAVMMQKSFRRYRCRRVLEERRQPRKQAIRALNKLIRARLGCGLDIQRVFRGHKARKLRRVLHLEWKRLDQAARRVQKAYRVSKGSYALNLKIAARREKNNLMMREKRRVSASCIQTAFRGYQARLVLRQKLCAKELEKERQNALCKRAATKIQVWWWKLRGNMAMANRVEMRRMRRDLQVASASLINRVYRGYLGRKVFKRKKARTLASIRIQCALRCALARRKGLRLRKRREKTIRDAAVTIQCMARMYNARARVHSLRRRYAATRIANFYRCCVATRLVKDLSEKRERERAQKALEHRSAVLIQKIARGYARKSKFTEFRRGVMATKIQNRLARPFLTKKILVKRRRVKNKQTSRVVSELKWQIVLRNQSAKLIQNNARAKAARAMMRMLKLEKRNQAARRIQRMCRVVLAKNIVVRAKRDRAACSIQACWRHFLEKRTLLHRFLARKQQMLDEMRAATKLQSLWRAKKGRENLRRMIKEERDRKVREKYLAERKRKMEEERLRLERLEAQAKKRRILAKEKHDKEYNRLVELGVIDKLRNGFRAPRWAKKLIDLDTLDRVLVSHKEQEEIRDAWVGILDEHSQETFYYNNITGETQWDMPEKLLEAYNKENKKQVVEQREVQRKEYFAKKRRARSYHKLVCHGKIDWVSAFAHCNRRATLFCVHCNKVFCPGCADRAHRRGPPRNHVPQPVEDVTRNEVCINCERQLVNRICNTCNNDGFCNACYKSTHENKPSHKTEEIIREKQQLILQADDEKCPSCEMSAATKRCTSCDEIYCDGCFEIMHEKGRRQEHEWVPANEKSTWKQLYDVNTSRYYYYNSFTEESVWVKPLVLMDKAEREQHEKAEAKREKKEKKKDKRSEEQKQIEVLEEELLQLKEWAEDLEIRKQQEQLLDAPEKFKRKGFLGRIIRDPNEFLANPMASVKTFETEIYHERKGYLEGMLCDPDGEQGDIEDVVNGSEESKQAYAAIMMQQMAQQRRDLRSDILSQTKQQLSGNALRNKLQQAEIEFKGVENAKVLVQECTKAGIKYGPKHSGPDKLDKQQAIQALVFYRHEQQVQAKLQVEEAKEQLKQAEESEKRLKKLQIATAKAKKGKKA